MTLSRVISLKDDDNYQLWSVPDFSTSPTSSNPGLSLSTTTDSVVEDKTLDSNIEETDLLEAAKQVVVDEVAAEVRQQYKKKFESILTAMSSPLERVNSAVERELVELSVAIAKVILQDEISEQPERLFKLAQQAIKQLPAASLNIAIHFHPREAELVSELFDPAENEQHWKIEANPALSIGECHIVTDTSFVDASVDVLVARLKKDILAKYAVTDFNENKTDGVI